MAKLQERVALIVGGASGIGRASAEACADEGARVMVTDIDEAGAADVAANLRARGATASSLALDVTDEAAVARAVRTTVDELGGLDILVTSMGGGSPEAGRWHHQIDLFLKGPYYACKYALEEMERRGGGSIINIASVAGITGSISAKTIDDTGYPSAKHGIVGMSRTLALAYAKHQIRVNVVCPGYIRTGLTRPLYDTEDGGQSFITDTLHVPLGRWGEPEDIGRAVAFLASDDASYITGQLLVVDGGLTAR